MKLRLSPQTRRVLDAFVKNPREWQYGYDISRNTGLKSGTLYPILIRLADRKLLETSWETVQDGRPPRHIYRLTAEGLQYVRAHRPLLSTGRLRRAALGAVKS
jgi:PadR family transcriptional regulator, regulatory protein PadR